MPESERSPRPETARESRGAFLRGYGSTAGLGLQCGASLAVCTLGGLWLDRRLGTLPWLLLLGVAAGLLGGFVLILRVANASSAGRRKPGPMAPHGADPTRPAPAAQGRPRPTDEEAP